MAFWSEFKQLTAKPRKPAQIVSAIEKKQTKRGIRTWKEKRNSFFRTRVYFTRSSTDLRAYNNSLPRNFQNPQGYSLAQRIFFLDSSNSWPYFRSTYVIFHPCFQILPVKSIRVWRFAGSVPKAVLRNLTVSNDTGFFLFLVWRWTTRWKIPSEARPVFRSKQRTNDTLWSGTNLVHNWYRGVPLQDKRTLTMGCLTGSANWDSKGPLLSID